MPSAIKTETKKFKIALSFFLLWITLWIWTDIIPISLVPIWLYYINIILLGLLLILWNLKDWETRKN